MKIKIIPPEIPNIKGNCQINSFLEFGSVGSVFHCASIPELNRETYNLLNLPHSYAQAFFVLHHEIIDEK